MHSLHKGSSSASNLTACQTSKEHKELLKDDLKMFLVVKALKPNKDRPPVHYGIGNNTQEAMQALGLQLWASLP